MSKPIPIKHFKEKYLYNPDTGLFKRVVGNCGNQDWYKGAKGSKGYIVLNKNKDNYAAHRIAWTWVNGEIPADKFVDHINGDKTDNRIANLRLATPSENLHNKKPYKTNTTGTVGVRKYNRTGKYTAEISVNGKRKHLGTFNTIEEAIDARQKAETAFGISAPVRAKEG